jgi:CBS domain-containing protein
MIRTWAAIATQENRFAAREEPTEMKIKDLMNTTLETVPPGATVREAAVKMAERHVGLLPVVDEGRLLGIVTDRDLVVRALSRGWTDRAVREVMTGEPACLSKEADIELAILTMEERKVGRLLVTDESGRLVGVLSAADVAIALAGDARAGHLAAILGGAHRRRATFLA